MSTDIGGRAVLRPAGNVARSSFRKASKPPRSPVKPPLKAPLSKISPPNSLPSTPRRTTPNKLSPHRPPTPSPVALHRHHDETSITPLDLASDGSEPAPITGNWPLLEATDVLGLEATDVPSNGSKPSDWEDEVAGANPLLYDAGFSGSEPTSHLHKSSLKGPKASLSESNSLPVLRKQPQNGSKSTYQKTFNPHIVLTKSTSEVFQRSRATSSVKVMPSSKKNLSKLGSLSFDESSLAIMVAAKKAAEKELSAQRKQKVAEYGRKQGKAGRVAPEVSLTLPLPSLDQQRCKFITSQSDPVFVEYHDKEWGVPVHDDRVLFELLALAGFQVELSWTTILHKRDAYRVVFAEFDPNAVALFSEKHIASLEADKTLGLPGGTVRGVVTNAQKILEVVYEYGSLDEYLWGFVNKQTMINNYRYPKQVPVKTSKAEFISKDLVKRGFRFVGPTIIYSFMQASGMTNDHLVQCFRHQECTSLSCSSSVLREEMLGGPIHDDAGAARQMHHLNIILKEERLDRGRECGEDNHSHEQEECIEELEEESHESNSAS